MPRYFIEVSYLGTGYSGFQAQDNANSIQAEVEKALLVYHKQALELTGSSRTDAGVHAFQNFFHFDSTGKLPDSAYNINALLPPGIAIKGIFEVSDDAHCRFDAISRQYRYQLYQRKNPFLQQTAYYYPYPLDIDKLHEAAKMVLANTDFTSFSKRNTQVKTFICQIMNCEWRQNSNGYEFEIKANRFLRGMVKGLVGTMLLVGRSKISLTEFKAILEAKDCTKADFSVPSKGLFLCEVQYNPDFQVQ